MNPQNRQRSRDPNFVKLSLKNYQTIVALINDVEEQGLSAEEQEVFDRCKKIVDNINRAIASKRRKVVA